MSNDPGYSPLTAEPYPLMELLGYRVTRWEEGLAEVTMPVEAIHGNRHGIPHGGIYALLMDTAAAFSGTNQGEGQPSARAMTLALNINFIGIPKGKVLTATGRKTGGGKSAFFSNVELRCDEDSLIATAQAALRYRKGPPPGQT